MSVASPPEGVARRCRLCGKTQVFRGGQWRDADVPTLAIGDHLHHWTAPWNGPDAILITPDGGRTVVDFKTDQLPPEIVKRQTDAYRELMGGDSTSWGARDDA